MEGCRRSGRGRQGVVRLAKLHGLTSVLAVAHGEASARVLLNSVLWYRIAKAVGCEPLHALYRFGQKGGRNRHQQLVIKHAAIAAFGKARNRKTGLSGFERAAP